jgi:hypothetical protein
MKIVNLTQHPATAEQHATGVFDLEGEALATLKGLLTFTEPPYQHEMKARAWEILTLVPEGVEAAMIGGAPYFMSYIEERLNLGGLLSSGRDAPPITAMYSFSERVSEEQTMPDGTVKKVNTFRHGGWVL